MPDNLQKIVTYIAYEESDEVQAMTREDFTTNANFDEWVWHLAPSKEQAIARHDEAWEAWYDTDAEYFTH